MQLVANKPSILLIKNHIYMIADGGVASCVEAKSGNVVWNERIGGNYSASPVTDGKRIFFLSEEGKTTVIAAKPEYKVLAVNQLDNGLMASPAIHKQAFILRTKTHLYRIAK